MCKNGGLCVKNGGLCVKSGGAGGKSGGARFFPLYSCLNFGSKTKNVDKMGD